MHQKLIQTMSLLVLGVPLPAHAQTTEGLLRHASMTTQAAPQCADTAGVIGRWDLTVTSGAQTYPSWLEVTKSGSCTLVGRFVARVGSARPISHIRYANGSMQFAIPTQWEAGNDDLRVDAKLTNGKLTGVINTSNGQQHSFTAERAPGLLRSVAPVLADSTSLFNGRDLDGWTSWPANGRNNWSVVDGVMTNRGSGVNLRTVREFTDFALHLEFRYPKGGNSGVHLRGRYEVQIEDTPRREVPESIDLGGIYGFLAPNQLLESKPGVWRAMDVTLVGRRVTVVIDGRTIISEQIIPGITGGAMDSREGAPGPILLQGDHTAIEFRNIRVKTVKDAARR